MKRQMIGLFLMVSSVAGASFGLGVPSLVGVLLVLLAANTFCALVVPNLCFLFVLLWSTLGMSLIILGAVRDAPLLL